MCLLQCFNMIKGGKASMLLKQFSFYNETFPSYMLNAGTNNMQNKYNPVGTASQVISLHQFHSNYNNCPTLPFINARD